MFQDLVAIAPSPTAVLPNWKHSMLHEATESRYTTEGKHFRSVGRPANSQGNSTVLSGVRPTYDWGDVVARRRHGEGVRETLSVRCDVDTSGWQKNEHTY